MKQMTSTQRFEAALKHETPDMVPISYFAGILQLHWVKENLLGRTPSSMAGMG